MPFRCILCFPCVAKSTHPELYIKWEETLPNPSNISSLLNRKLGGAKYKLECRVFQFRSFFQVSHIQASAGICLSDRTVVKTKQKQHTPTTQQTYKNQTKNKWHIPSDHRGVCHASTSSLLCARSWTGGKTGITTDFMTRVKGQC